ncbi:MAG: ECF transporter S component [Candidatus Nanopelagicales bacterium]
MSATSKPRAIPISPTSAASLLFTVLVGGLAFGWPLFVDPTALLAADPTGAVIAPFLFAGVILLALSVVAVSLTREEIGVKSLAMLGVLAAMTALVRPLGAGTAGIELVFFVIILGGRVYGPGFGFALGAVGLLASALITVGIGPWLPYQMLAAGFVGLGAGLLPRAGGRAEIALLAVYGVISALAYGYLMDFAFWPFVFGMTDESQLGFDPHAGALANLHTFFVTNTVTSLGWNLGRALTNTVLIVFLGKPILRVLRRSAVRAELA